jgi:hypothetical protein
MAPSPVLALSEHFAHLDDPRGERTRLHQLLDIVVIAICAVIAGAESWVDIALSGEAKRANQSNSKTVSGSHFHRRSILKSAQSLLSVI